MLHIVSHSPAQFDIEALLRIIKADDVVLFIQDGVVSVLENSTLLLALQGRCLQVYALEEDIKARGLSLFTSEQINIINYGGFVDLTVAHVPQLSW